MYIKLVRDDEKKFYLGGKRKDSAAWGITEIEGAGLAENELYTVVPATGDGEEVSGERIPGRHIDIAANVKNRRLNEVERKNALSFFNTKHSYTVHITNGGGTKWIAARIERFQCKKVADDKHTELNLSLMCPDPYFYSVDNFGKNIAAVTRSFGFPYISPIGDGFRTGIYNFAKQVEIENIGDVDTYATIIIEATGQVENPKIIQNGAFIRIIDMLESGDVVEINMVENTIKKNGENCIGKVDRHSYFSGMVIKPGDNQISFDADNGDTNMKVVLYYNLRYLEV